MGREIAQRTRELAEEMESLSQVKEVMSHDPSSGYVTFSVNSPVSPHRVSRLLPNGWSAYFVVTNDNLTNAYVEKE